MEARVSQEDSHAIPPYFIPVNEKERRRSATPAQAARRWQAYLFVVLALYAVLQAVYIRATPLQSIGLPDNLPARSAKTPLLVGLGPDEKEHYLYILSIAQGRTMPKPTPEWRTSPSQYVTYEAQHPPLFYAVGATLYQITPFASESGFLYLLRAFCTLCGVVVILLAAQAARVAFPDRPFIYWAMPPVIAFTPMFGHMTACISNEPLAMLFGTWAWLNICQIARSEKRPTTRAMVYLGLALGLAALTRLTALLWLVPAAAVLHRNAYRTGLLAGIRNALIMLGVTLLTLYPWLVYNLQTFHRLLVRPFDRPMLQNTTLLEYLSNPKQPIHIVSGALVINIVLTPLITALWYTSSSIVPFWLIQFYLPGFPGALSALQSPFILFDVLVLVLLFLHASESRRNQATVPADPVARLLIWCAGGIIGVCVIALLQQQLYSDWDILHSAGRYLVAFIPASALVMLFAFSTRLRSARSQAIGVAFVFAWVLALDIQCDVWVNRFYNEHPKQEDVQHIAAAPIALPSGANRLNG